MFTRWVFTGSTNGRCKRFYDGELPPPIFLCSILFLIYSIEKPTKMQMESILKKHLSGTSRTPAMCYGTVSTEVSSLNLGSYEISPVEPLHDIKGHIKNLWELLPHHLPEDLKDKFSNDLH